MPNRRRRKLSTAMSAVAALAVASPFAVTAVSDLTAASKPAPEQHDFVQAAMVTDLPGEIMSALQSSLSQFGVVVPNMPSGIMGAGAPTTPALGGLTAPAATPGLTAPGLTGPGLTAPGLTRAGTHRAHRGGTHRPIAREPGTDSRNRTRPASHYADQPGHPGPDHAAGRTDDARTDTGRSDTSWTDDPRTDAGRTDGADRG